MCLIAFSWQPDGETPLTLLANRDEFYARATAPCAWWHDAPQVLAGRDLATEAQGTWMGITRNGRFAALTNIRAPGEKIPTARSRGEICADFLKSTQSTPAFLNELADKAHKYNGFNLLLGEFNVASISAQTPSLWYFNSRNRQPAQQLNSGVYGLSNAQLDTPWPKVLKLVGNLSVLRAQNGNAANLQSYFDLLADSTPAPSNLLPTTGVSSEWEQKLSSIFIAGSDYGTRASSVLLVRREGFLLGEKNFSSEKNADEQIALKNITLDKAIHTFEANFETLNIQFAASRTTPSN